MLLSIDRVLQLLAEGKSLEKIASLAKCDPSNVVDVLQEARRIIDRYEKPAGRKKIIIKSGEQSSDKRDEANDESVAELLSGVELSALPVGSSLTIYIDAAIDQESGQTGIGILVYDREGHQLAKVSLPVGRTSMIQALYVALIKALRIAAYFKTRTLRIRTDSEHLVQMVGGKRQIKSEKLMASHETALREIHNIPDFRIEHATYALTDKADFLAHKASERFSK